MFCLSPEIFAARIFEEKTITNTTKRTIGIILAILGMALLILNAADYVMKWNLISSGISVIGLMLAVIGVGLARRTKDVQQEQDKQ